MTQTRLLVLALALVFVAAAPAVADPLQTSRSVGHGPMCGASCRNGDGLGHARPSAVQYGDPDAHADGASDGLRPDRCRMPCSHTRSCCFHRVRTAGEKPTCGHCTKPPA